MRIRRCEVVVVGLLVAGCGSSTNTGGGNPIPIDDLGSQYVAAGCDYLVRCNSISDTALCIWLFTPLFQMTSFNSFAMASASASTVSVVMLLALTKNMSVMSQKAAERCAPETPSCP